MDTDILSDLIITKIHSVSTMYNEKNTGGKRNNRPVWAFVIKYEGETRYRSNGREYISNINNLAVLPKGCSYDWRCVESGHFSIVEFECDMSGSEIFTFNVNNGETYLEILKRMEIDRALKKTACKLDEFKNLYGLISSMVKTIDKKYVPSDRKQKISKAIEYIARNYNKRIRNDELACVSDLSVAYFRKLFRDATGMSPINYVRLFKIKKAKEMLKSDYSSITDIAFSLGYNNVYEFSREFKKCSGISPSEFKKQ